MPISKSAAGSYLALNVTMGARHETTDKFEYGAPAFALQTTLHRVEGLGAVVVTRHGAVPGVTKLMYRVTFISRAAPSVSVLRL